MTNPRLQLAHITKRYPSVVANYDCRWRCRPARRTPCWAKTAPANPPWWRRIEISTTCAALSHREQPSIVMKILTW